MSTQLSTGQVGGLPQLDAIAQRVLGCLLEKQVTVPESYPLSLNALRTAANQSSSRHPVTDYDDAALLECIKVLKDAELLRTVWAGRGSRALKYHQLLDERLAPLSAAERAVLTVLLLRGEQSAGELKTRTDRLFSFADRGEAESVLQALAARQPALVRELPKRAGRQDPRWIHLLGPVDTGEPAAVSATPVVDRDVVLAKGAQARDRAVREAWDANAVAYAERYIDDLDDKPLECWLLERVAMLSGRDPVVEVGCGPGQISAYLAEFGADVTGVDLAPAMVAEAARRFPDLTFEVGDQAKLLRPLSAHGWGAVVSFYSTVHLAGSELEPTIAALTRVLRPGGWLLLAVRIGDEVRHLSTDLSGEPIDLDIVFHDPEQVLAAVAAAGLTHVEWYKRGPVAGEEDPERFFVLACTPRPQS